LKNQMPQAVKKIAQILPYSRANDFTLLFLTLCECNHGVGKSKSKLSSFGGTGTDSTIPTNTVQVPITTGTVTDSGSEYTALLG